MTPDAGVSSSTEAVAQARPDGKTLFSCQSPAAPLPCYGPDQLRVAYGVQPLLDSGISGAGRTIVVIAGFQEPSLARDVADFNAAWGLAPTSLEVSAPDGLTPFNPANPQEVNWAIEIATDVEWAHVIAPAARIHVVLGRSGDDADLLSATRYAVSHKLGDVISQSFGEAETCPSRHFLEQEHAIFAAACAKGMTVLASSGDFGAAERDYAGKVVHAVSTPASDPLVTAVGGTRLVADPVTGAYGSEVTWDDQFGAGGGGFSKIYERPGYQRGFQRHDGRGIPDVAWSSDAFGAIVVRAGGKFRLIFGTSGATAQWAGVAALLDQSAHRRLGLLNSTLYRIGKSDAYNFAFHDIRVGSNSFAGFTGATAMRGWDAATGLGSPKVNHLAGLVKHEGEDAGDD